MPFIVIRGTFRLEGINKKGQPTGFQPDGDSIQFKPDKVSLLSKEYSSFRALIRISADCSQAGDLAEK